MPSLRQMPFQSEALTIERSQQYILILRKLRLSCDFSGNGLQIEIVQELRKCRIWWQVAAPFVARAGG